MSAVFSSDSLFIKKPSSNSKPQTNLESVHSERNKQLREKKKSSALLSRIAIRFLPAQLVLVNAVFDSQLEVIELCLVMVVFHFEKLL